MEVICVLSNGDINYLDEPLTRFSSPRHIEVKYLKNLGKSYHRTLVGNCMPSLSNDITFNDLDWFFTGISRSRYYSTLNMDWT